MEPTADRLVTFASDPQTGHRNQVRLTGRTTFNRSPRNIEKVKQCSRVGHLHVDRKSTWALVQRKPFGEFTLSVNGSKAGGPVYLLQFVVPRVITVYTL